MPLRLICSVLVFGLLLPGAAAAGLPEIAVHAGLNSSTYHEDDLSDDARERPAFGIGARLPLAEGFALMPEVWYMQKGFKAGLLWDRIALQGKLDTVTVPLLLSYWFQANASEPRAFLGLAVDFVLKSQIERHDDPGNWLDVTDQDRSTYWSLVLGGGTRIRGWLDIDIRYQHAFTPVTNFDYREFDDVVSEAQEFDDAFDRTWTLTAGVWF